MKQTRLSIGCQDWQEITAKIGPAATGVLLYLRLTMRKMQAAEITIGTAELAEALKLDAETVGNLLCMILDAELLDAVPGSDGLTTYRSKEEAAALADRFRKRASSSRRKLAARLASVTPKGGGNSGYTLFAQTGNSGITQGAQADTCEEKEYTSEVVMVYDPESGGRSEYTLSDQTGNSGKAEKEPHTPQKEESLTEIQTHARSNKTCVQAELPADSLEAEYIDVAGSWQPSLRQAVRTEAEETREAFYLFCRLKAESGERMSGDRVRAAWLAARRIPAERRADSILAAALGGWKTIRDCGSGVYFEKETGRVVSLVRGPVQHAASTEQKANEDLAIRLARSMRRS